MYAADSPELQQLIEPDLWEQFQEDKELLEVRRHRQSAHTAAATTLMAPLVHLCNH